MVQPSVSAVGYSGSYAFTQVSITYGSGLLMFPKHVFVYNVI